MPACNPHNDDDDDKSKGKKIKVKNGEKMMVFQLSTKWPFPQHCTN